MSRTVYNGALAAGLLLVGVGVGLWSIAAALVTVGALVIALTVVGAYFAR